MSWDKSCVHRLRGRRSMERASRIKAAAHTGKRINGLRLILFAMAR